LRTVSEIVEAVQQQQPATEEELRMALLCLYYDNTMACDSDFEKASELKLRMRAKENFGRRFRMMKADPATYLGSRWTPGTQENAEGRAMSTKITDAFLKSRGEK